MNKCVLGKPDCGLLTDNMALMWGEVKDAVDELTSVMAANEAECKATSDGHNGEINMWQGINSQKNVELSDATGALNAHTEEQTESQASKDMLTKEYDEVMGECTAVLHEILFTKICGTQTVRGEIAKFSETYGPTDIHDCLVTDWIPQECSIECIDQVLCDGAKEGELPHPSCAGGVQNMTRNVVQNESLGAACPALVLTKGCNNQPCPINCEQSEWSPFGKCTKECGGGIQQRSRNVVVKPDNGGEVCGPASDAQTCNVQLCTLHVCAKFADPLPTHRHATCRAATSIACSPSGPSGAPAAGRATAVSRSALRRRSRRPRGTGNACTTRTPSASSSKPATRWNA